METETFFESRYKKIRNQSGLLKQLAETRETPFYLFDANEVRQNLSLFRNAFLNEGIDISVFYAVKSNYYKGLLKTVVGEGGGLDVSSRRELELALQAGAKRIIYTGPAKSEKDFEKILEHHEKITVNLETLREMKLLAEMASERGVRIRCGARIFSPMQTGWTKFGIPLEEFADFFRAAQTLTSLDFCGIHFHMSFVDDPDVYVKTMDQLSLYLKKHLTDDERRRLEYLDIGGGYYPQQFQALYAWNTDQKTDLPKDYIDRIFEDKFSPRILPMETQAIEVFAREIGRAFKTKILPLLPEVRLYAEPGRFISHSSMHFLLRLMDVKKGPIGIADGGINLIGWELFQFFYYVPIFNLSRFSASREIPFVTYGSLCTPDDIWGYYMYTAGPPQEGDILLIPYQGAYTYTLAQNFIREIPPVIDFDSDKNGSMM